MGLFYFCERRIELSTKIADIVKSTKGYMKKHSPEILTGIGVTGMITTTVLAVKATPKAMELIEYKKDELSKEYGMRVEELSYKEIVMVAWKPYIPAVLTGIASISCIIGASAVNAKRNAALATAYSISERALVRYRDKVIDTIGEKKEKEIREKVSQDQVDKNPVSQSQVFITQKGNTLCRDEISGRYFRSDLDHIRKSVNELNRDMTFQDYISLDEFYSKLGLEPTKNSAYLGWNLQDGLIELHFDTCLAENDEPCIVIDYNIAPKYDFDKMV